MTRNLGADLARESVWDCLKRNGRAVAITNCSTAYLLDGERCGFRDLLDAANAYRRAEGLPLFLGHRRSKP